MQLNLLGDALLFRDCATCNKYISEYLKYNKMSIGDLRTYFGYLFRHLGILKPDIWTSFFYFYVF